MLVRAGAGWRVDIRLDSDVVITSRPSVVRSEHTSFFVSNSDLCRDLPMNSRGKVFLLENRA